MSDPCECVFNHAAMMRRLISILQDTQADCTDTECSQSSLSVDGGNGNMMLIAMAWGLLAMFMFFMRPSSMRSGGQGQIEGKPRSNNNDQSGNDGPPAPDVH